MRQDLQSFKHTLVDLISEALLFVERARIDAASLRSNQRQSIFTTLDRLREAQRSARAIIVEASRPGSSSRTSISFQSSLSRYLRFALWGRLYSMNIGAGAATMAFNPIDIDSEYDASQSEPGGSSQDNTLEIDMDANDTAMSQSSDPLAPVAEPHGGRLSPVAEEGQSAASAGPSRSGETHQEPRRAPGQKRKRHLVHRSDDVEGSDSEMGESGHANETKVPVAKARRT
jgi:hypothetical protein